MGGVTAHAAALRASIEEDTAAMWEVLGSISQHFDIALAPYARRRRRQWANRFKEAINRAIASVADPRERRPESPPRAAGVATQDRSRRASPPNPPPGRRGGHQDSAETSTDNSVAALQPGPVSTDLDSVPARRSKTPVSTVQLQYVQAAGQQTPGLTVCDAALALAYEQGVDVVCL